MCRRWKLADALCDQIVRYKWNCTTLLSPCYSVIAGSLRLHYRVICYAHNVLTSETGYASRAAISELKPILIARPLARDVPPLTDLFFFLNSMFILHCLSTTRDVLRVAMVCRAGKGNSELYRGVAIDLKRMGHGK